MIIIKKHKTYKGFIAFISFFLLLSCGSSENDSNDILKDIFPENLNIEVTIIGIDANNLNGDGSGQIKVTASATNAASYRIKFGDGNETTNASGIVEHKYLTEGLKTYNIEVFAISSDGNSIGDFKKIDIFTSQNGTSLIWSDEFNTDGAPNANNWGFDIGTGSNGWGNGESQYYTNSSNNVIVENGLLKITAKKENFNGAQYTSSRLLSKGKFDFKYGRVEVRAKLPQGKGTWPAIWMLGANFETVSWPACGEIDIMEHVGNDQNKIHSTLHYPNNSGGNGNGNSITVSNVSSEFHIYEVVWSATSIVFTVDGNQIHSFSNNNNVPFNHNFFLILNVAMGGSFGGAIDANFTQSTMDVDYIKVYQ
jgi:beta-glucanase (GH16 family)